MGAAPAMSSTASPMARRWAPVSWKGSSWAKPWGNWLGMGVEVLAFSPAFDPQQSQLQHQKFLKGQAEPGGGDFL